MAFTEVIEMVGQWVDGAGVAVTVIGLAGALALFLYHSVASGDRAEAYSQARRNMGRSILLGLELLVAGDIIRTVAVSPTFESVGVLGIIVLIRSFLSMTLEVEISGVWPWQQKTGEQPAA